ncbi:nitrosoguanidine resistance sng1 [Trichoderma cornu-damae]|uniref:Nitrosoguanidine resistance sng1 n=1 Tax=Trichoderma cornu-damae TaxID=654480 RepID=A0A9P8QQR9_9HYPO|nr:nitrosoguanidine resistance sng1 [Trichoderma cornu-damae]
MSLEVDFGGNIPGCGSTVSLIPPPHSVRASMMPLSIINRFYPRACENRLPVSHPEIAAVRVKFFTAALLNLQVPRTHNFHILWVDYDGGIIGDAVRNAYSSLQSNEFPGLVEQTVSQFPTTNDLREAVCSSHYWAALYTSPGASVNLGLAIAGSNTSQYNESDVLSFIWNEAKYPTVMDSLVAGDLHTLSDAARVSYIALNGTSAFLTIPPNNSAAISVFTNPWTLTPINIKPTTQGTRSVYNTIAIVLVLIEDFFYLATINGLYAQFKVYSRIAPTRIILVRDAISITFTMIGSLVNSAAIWAFKANWHLSGGQYAINWLILWLFAHTNFLTFDVFTIWLPPQYISMALITWVVINVSSAILPFSLSSPFYRWGYVLPAHAAYELLIDNWSGGCNPHLSYALPVLFAYEVSGLVLTGIGVYKRCHYAVIMDETTKEAMRLRVEAALKLEREGDGLVGQESGEKDLQKPDTGEPSRAATDVVTPNHGNDTDGQHRRHVEREFEELDSEIDRMETRASRLSNIGPAFRLIGSEIE